MPARKMFFTFDTNVKVNKKTIEEFKDDFEIFCPNLMGEEALREFNHVEFDKEFMQEFIKTMKGFDCVSYECGDVFGKQRIVVNFIHSVIAEEEANAPLTTLGIRYLYDEWDYEGCGSEDYYYLTYTDVKKMTKKYIKEFKAAADKLRGMGVKVSFSIDEQ